MQLTKFNFHSLQLEFNILLLCMFFLRLISSWSVNINIIILSFMQYNLLFSLLLSY